MKKISLFLLFFLGFLGGMLWALLDERWMELSILLGWDRLWKIGQMEIDKRALFFLVCGKRLRAFFILWVFSLTVLRRGMAFGFFFFWGLSTGIAVQLLALLYGGWSLLLYPALVLPQILFYVPAFWGMGSLCIKEEAPGRKEMAESLGFLMLLLAGGAAEAWVGLEILKLIVTWI